MFIEATQATQVTSAYKTDVMKGNLDKTVSSNWWNRPADQRFLNLSDLEDSVLARSENTETYIADLSKTRVVLDREDEDKLSLEFNDKIIDPTHWSFGQLASLAGAPAGYMRKLPSKLAAINLQYGLANFREENIKMYYNNDQLLAATGVNYGRVQDIELVRAVRKIAGDGVGDTNWKVPGAIDWAHGTYNPFVNITSDTTTLYASDRDVFMFLVDDTHPIEIGKLNNGDPDLVFRGFYVWNSEVGSKSLGISTFLLRGVCQNRCLWGVEDKNTIMIRHSKNAPHRFASEVSPGLIEYSNGGTGGILEGVYKAKSAVVARTDDDRKEFLGKRGFSAKQTQTIIDAVINEEDKKPESVWDFVQGITAVARDIQHTDARLDMEKIAGKLMEQAAK
jgi:hypothetical protein